MTERAHTAPATSAGDTGEAEMESDVLLEMARTLEMLAKRLPDGSRWRQTLIVIADKAAAGAEISRRAQHYQDRQQAA